MPYASLCTEGLPKLPGIISGIVLKKSGKGADIVKAHLPHDVGDGQRGILQ